MSRTLTEIDAAFTEHYKQLLDVQKTVVEQLKAYTYDLSKTEITDAIIERMNAFWYFNSQNNWGLLGRKSNPVSADFFTETCLLFFKTYFEQDRYGGLKVESEKNIKLEKSRNPVRPDITICTNDDQLLAVIELKVSDGWKGIGIEEHLRQREAQVRAYHPNAWFGVLAFWNFTKPDAPQWGKKYFGLLNHQKDRKHIRTDVRVEQILQQIQQHLNTTL